MSTGFRPNSKFSIIIERIERLFSVNRFLIKKNFHYQNIKQKSNLAVA